MKKTSALVFCFALFFMVGLLMAEAATPNMVGTWTGPGRGVTSDGSYFDATLSLVVTAQNGRFYYGILTVVVSGGPTKILPFAGGIQINKAIYIALGIDPDTSQPSGTLVNGKLTGKTINATWQNLVNGQVGECVLKKS